MVQIQHPCLRFPGPILGPLTTRPHKTRNKRALSASVPCPFLLMATRASRAEWCLGFVVLRPHPHGPLGICRKIHVFCDEGIHARINLCALRPRQSCRACSFAAACGRSAGFRTNGKARPGTVGMLRAEAGRGDDSRTTMLLVYETMNI